MYGGLPLTHRHLQRANFLPAEAPLGLAVDS
jgi:hypothetical protein